MLSPILRQLDLANSLTLGGLFLSFVAVLLSVNGHFNLAMICLIYAGIIDLFDGFVARKLQRSPLQSAAGQQLDSLVDLCSFGFAPAIFGYCVGLQNLVSILVLMFYIMANALRLAYFNSTGLSSQGDDDYFTGLPVTYAALFIPLFFATHFIFPHIKLVFCSVYLLLAMAMVANFKVFKLQGIWYGIFAVGAIALTGVYSWGIVTGMN
ncbi:MAG: CDP-alcohol phosphatidyltransferase family protein [Cyanobacteria bacterium P01_C01_bin.118]